MTGTLASRHMQEYDFIPVLQIESGKFWNGVRHTARLHDTDEVLAYMLVDAFEAELLEHLRAVMKPGMH